MVRVNGRDPFSKRILRLAFALMVVASAEVVSRPQERLDRGALAEEVRSLNQELDRSLLSSRASVPRILAERAARLSELIRSDPQAAVRLSLSAAQAARLSAVSPDVASQIESQGEWHGALTVLVEDDFPLGTSRTRYWIETGGERVEVYFANHPRGLSSGQVVSVRGIRLGKRMAAALTGISPVAAAPSACGPIGEQRIAVLMLEFPDVPFPYSVVTPSELHDIYFSSSKVSLDGYLREASYGKTFATGDVFGPIKLDQNYDFLTQQFEGLDAAIRAVDPTLDLTVYNHLVLIWPSPGVSGWGGRGVLSCTELDSPSKGNLMGTYAIMGVGTRQPYAGMVALAAHEEGHNLGLNHASSLDYAPLALGPPGVDGVHQEYGDPFSIMGGGGEGQLFFPHYDAPHKAQLGWLDPGSVLNVETDGTFLLQPLENPGGVRAIRVRRGPTGDQWLWLEYRQPIGYDATLGGLGSQQFSGALIHYEDPAQSQQRPYYTFLLDFTPNTPHVFSDAALAAGQAWPDPYSSLTIGITSASPSGLGVSIAYRSPCVTLNPNSRNHGSGAETGAFAITAPGTCSWTATASASWITITGGQSGTGSGTVSYAVAANNTPTARTGSILAGFQAFTITQATSFVNQPPSLDSVSPSAGAGISQTFTFTASDPNGAADLRNIDVDFVRSGSNRFICQVSYIMASRELGFLADDQKTFAGPFTAGSNVALQNSQCGVDVSGVTVTSSGNSMQLSFPMVFFGSGTWSIQVNLYNYAKTDVGGIVGSWTVAPSACSYSIGPAGAIAGKNETAGTITIAAGPGCPWLASASAPWITITSAVAGVGGGAVSYAIAANTTPVPRTGVITIAGQTFPVSQSVTAGLRPVISANGVVNGASYQPGMASATWIAIFGSNLAPVTQAWGALDFVGNRLPTQLGGVSVSIDGKPAYIYYISPTQINMLAPDYLAEAVSVEVDTPDGRSNAVTAQKTQFSPALFLFDQGGRKYAAAVHLDGAYVAPAGLIPGATSRPASPGEIIMLFGTGFGATDPTSPSAELVSQPAPLSTPTVIRIGGAAAETSFAGLATSGLYQFNVTVPDIANGDQLVVIEIGGFRSQDNTYISVGPHTAAQ